MRIFPTVVNHIQTITLLTWLAKPAQIVLFRVFSPLTCLFTRSRSLSENEVSSFDKRPMGLQEEKKSP